MMPRILASRSALAVAVTMALAACGSADDNGVHPKDNANANADNTLTTKAPAAGAITAQGVRGDVLIQALLSTSNYLDPENRPLVAWNSPQTMTTASGSQPFLAPAVIVSQQVGHDADNASLGRNVYSLRTIQGPFHARLDGSADNMPRRSIDTIGVAFSVSDTTARANTTSLQLGRQLNLSVTPNAQLDFDNAIITARETLTADAALTLDASRIYRWNDAANADDVTHRWKRADHAEGGQPTDLVIRRLAAANEFAICLKIGREFAGYTHELCTEWAVADWWSTGLPLTLMRQTVTDSYGAPTDRNRVSYRWNTTPERTLALTEDITTTRSAINEHGISGAVLAAMFDAWSARARGMQALPPFAGAATGPLSATAAPHGPYRASIYHENRATQFADGGNANTPGYSPAVGQYLYAYLLGAYLGSGQPRAAYEHFPQLNFSLHLNNNPQTGLVLPRWTGFNVLTGSVASGQRWLYQGEQLINEHTAKTIAPNQLLMFGSVVQTWYDPVVENSTETSSAGVKLSIEKSRAGSRSVDLCWETALNNSNHIKNCTLWTIPANWTPGQILRPEGYYISRNNGRQNWNTFAPAP